MDSDFHYYGTGTAALAAGFSKTNARLIANVAQYVDWFDSDYWSYWNIVDSRGKAVVNPKLKSHYCYEHPQLSIQKIGAKMVVDYDQNIWNPFHFPPGNLPYSVETGGWKKEFCDQHVVRRTKLSKKDRNKLCRPYSKFALDLIEDTIEKYQVLSQTKGKALEDLVGNLVAPRIRCPVSEGRKLANFLLGVRMHILADTWAHQDFAGEQNKKINFCGYDHEVTAKDSKGKYQKTIWEGTLWALVGDSDCAAAPPPTGNGPCAGHGQMGHYPDYSWLTFKYPAAWLPKDTKFHVRENPSEYEQAWSWLSYVLGRCQGKLTDEDLPAKPPKEISRVIRTWHKLSTTEFQAIEKSEQRWRKTSLGRRIPKRWDPGKRGRLGLYDGLALTRYGQINVKQNSTLHYMETANSMHYQFCVDWIAKNPEYSWVPWKPQT